MTIFEESYVRISRWYNCIFVADAAVHIIVGDGTGTAVYIVGDGHWYRSAFKNCRAHHWYSSLKLFLQISFAI